VGFQQRFPNGQIDKIILMVTGIFKRGNPKRSQNMLGTLIVNGPWTLGECMSTPATEEVSCWNIHLEKFSRRGNQMAKMSSW